jgi:hypothetical protein
VAARVGEVKWRLVGLALGLCFYAALWVGVAAGATGLEGVLITVPVLVLLIAGGNWLQHWLGVQRRPPQFARPGTGERHDDDAAPPPP